MPLFQIAVNNTVVFVPHWLLL